MHHSFLSSACTWLCTIYLSSMPTPCTTSNLLCGTDWNILSGAWTHDSAACTLSNTNLVSGANIWFGSPDGLTPDATYEHTSFRMRSVFQITSGADAGIMFRASQASAVNNQGPNYYVGLRPAKSSVFGMMNYGYSLIKTYGSLTSYNTVYEVEVIANGSSYTVSINGSLVLQDLHHTTLATTAGSIGLRAYQAPAIYHVLEYEGYPPPSSSPSNTPSENPTTEPPSKSPTKTPSENPTTFPTDPPSKSPTKTPTLFPTRPPTANPMTDPTSSPTKNPTSLPTGNPTSYRSSAPTQRPSATPTAYPTSPAPTLRIGISKTPTRKTRTTLNTEEVMQSSLNTETSNENENDNVQHMKSSFAESNQWIVYIFAAVFICIVCAALGFCIARNCKKQRKHVHVSNVVMMSSPGNNAASDTTAAMSSSMRNNSAVSVTPQHPSAVHTMQQNNMRGRGSNAEELYERYPQHVEVTVGGPRLMATPEVPSNGDGDVGHEGRDSDDSEGMYDSNNLHGATRTAP